VGVGWLARPGCVVGVGWLVGPGCVEDVGWPVAGGMVFFTDVGCGCAPGLWLVTYVVQNAFVDVTVPPPAAISARNAGDVVRPEVDDPPEPPDVEAPVESPDVAPVPVVPVVARPARNAVQRPKVAWPIFIPWVGPTALVEPPPLDPVVPLVEPAPTRVRGNGAETVDG